MLAKFHGLEKSALLKSEEHVLEDDAIVEHVEDCKESMRRYFGNEQEHGPIARYLRL